MWKEDSRTNPELLMFKYGYVSGAQSTLITTRLPLETGVTEWVTIWSY